MTKFEEEFKALTSWDWVNVDLIQKILTKFGNWHSDEEFQAKEKEIKRLRKINHLYKKAKGNAERLAVDRGERLNQAQDELASLESQLQQQALPVVPEEVDKAIKYLKTQNNFATLTDLKNLDILTEKGFWWLNDFQFKDRRFGFGGLNNKLFILSHLAITGYQVEKPQLFYIDLPKVFGLSDSTSDSTFVSKAESGIILEFTKGKDYALKLTEQEIKSIDERYWQFAVPVEEEK
ncbi:DUF1642 domain-containing protein [Lactococcus lactis subsp. lactis]|uniref:DUF1642 domain-containing protein n=1 Tax=Lactococcus lactis TaxID=1358 RepID=UPI003748B6E5